MAPVPPAAFRSLLGSLDEAALAAFLADVWRARGFDVERADGRFRATRDGTTLDVAAVSGRLRDRVRPRTRRPVDADVVVIAGRGRPEWVDAADAQVLGADDVREMVLYGVAAPERERLFRAHLGRASGATPMEQTPLAALAPLLPAPVARLGNAVFVAAEGVSAVAGARTALAAALLMAAGLVAGPALLADLAPPPAADETATPTDAPSPTFVPLVERAETTRTPRPTPAGPPPGVDDAGVRDAGRLVAAHAGVLQSAGYRLQLVYRETAPNHTATVQESTTRRDRTRWGTSVRRGASLRTDPWPVAAADAYADGDRRYVRTVDNGSVSYRSSPVDESGPAPPDERSRALVAAALSDAETTVERRFVRDGTTFYRVAFTHPDGSVTRNSTGVALVDEAGVVRYLRWTYERVPESVTLTVVMRVGPLGAADSGEPGWVGAARNVTGEA